MRYAVLGLFLFVMILVGLLSYRKVQTTEDYILGGRTIGPWLASFSYGTTYFSAVIFVGYAGRYGWQFGLSAVWIGIGNALIGSLLAWLLLAERTRRISQAMGVGTLAEFFKKRYDSLGMERLAALIVFVFLIPYSASVYQGLGYVMQRYFHGTVLADLRVSMLLIALVTGLYLFFGGYLSTAINSLIQGLIMTVGVVWMLVRVIGLSGGLAQGVTQLSAMQTANPGPGALTAVFGPDPLQLVTLILMTSLGTLGLPQMIAKYNGIRDRVAVRRATVMSTVLALVIGGSAYLMGGFSRLLTQKLAVSFDVDNLDTLMPALFEAILSPPLMAVFIVLMMSASMSTLASVVLVSAPTVTRSLLGQNKVLAMRLASLLFVFLSYVIAVFPSAIVTLMSFSWGAVSGAFIGPYIWGLYDRSATRLGALCGMIGGLMTVVLGAILVLAFKASPGIWAPRLAVLAMANSLIVTPLASRLLRPWCPLPKGAMYL